MTMMRIDIIILRYLLVIGLVAAYSYTNPVAAMSVSPVVLELSTVGSVNHGQITVVNDAATPLPVEISISRIDLTVDGEVTSKAAGDEFLVFPPQAMLPSGATQVFRLQWVGDPQIKTSQSYIFSVNQVPVKVTSGKTGVQVVFNFGCVVNVAPQQGSASINLVKSAVGKDEKGKSRAELTVSNSGNLHAKLSDATIRLSSGAWSETLTPEKLRVAMGIGLVQPGKTRRFLIPVELPTGSTQISATIDYTNRKK